MEMRRYGSTAKVAIWVLAGLLITSVAGFAESGHKTSPSVTALDSPAAFSAALARSDTDLVMVKFYADWCPPCQLLKPIYERIAKSYQGRVVAYTLDVDKLRHIAMKYRVRGIPTVLFFKSRQVVDTLSGLRPESDYIDAIKRHLKSAG
jgi:thioredoxin